MKTGKNARVMLLSQKLMLGSVILVFLAIGFTIVMVLRLNLKLQSHRTETTLHDLGEMVAANPLVIQAFKEDQSSEELILYLDNLIKGLRDVDVITLADMRLRRLYHVNRSRIGENFVGGDEERVLRGERYFSRAVGSLGDQKRYFVPVFDAETQKEIGFIVVASLMTDIASQRREIYEAHFRTFLLILATGLLAAWLTARGIKKTLLGYEPEQLSKFFLERDEVLNSLEEGIVAVDAAGYITLVNKAAGTMLHIAPEDLRVRLLDDIYPQIRIGETLASGEPLYNSGIILGDVNILCNRIPIRENGTLLGAVAILRNRTELTRMAEELTGVNHMIDALRSNSHEFMNKMQVILGLLRIGEPEEAERYITGIAREQSDVIAAVLQKIRNKNLGALLLGKMSHCRELDIEFKLVGSSSVPAVSRFLSGDAFVTLVGNLVENAIEAVNSKAKGEGDREVSLLIHEDERSLMVTVDDTGEGMTPEEIEHVRQGGYSSKGRHRGTGMKLIRSVLESNGGEMQIDSEKGAGTSITVCFTREGKL